MSTPRGPPDAGGREAMLQLAGCCEAQGADALEVRHQLLSHSQQETL